MKVLVTGATGFVGSHLTRRLARDGHAVRILTRASDPPASVTGVPLEVARGDVTDPSAVDRAVRGVEAVYHLASNFRQVGASASASHAVHVQGTVHIVEAALRHGVRRLVHCSTGGIHGPSTNGPLTEDAPYRYARWNIYETTKAEADQLVLRAAAERKLPAVVVRPAIVYGPGDRRLLKLFKAIAKRRFVMLGSGQVKYHLAYVEDVVDGMLLCGDRKAAVGEAFILAGAQCPTLQEVVSLIAGTLNVSVPSWRLPLAPFYAAGYLCEVACKPLGIEPPLHRRRVEIFRSHRAFDISKAQRVLGYAPRISPEEGIRRTVRWYQEQGWLNG